MNDKIEQFTKRKQDHIQFALDAHTQAVGMSGLDKINLIHEAIPELDFAEVDISTQTLGQHLAAPFLVSSMTAGHEAAGNINETLAIACQQRGWLMGVGSQRRQLFDARAADEWKAIRRSAPQAKLLGNIGLSQLIHTPILKIQALVDSINAIAMIVHTNPLQEVIQPEGTPNFKGSLQILKQLCQELSVPVIVKETGCGFSQQTLARLNDIGVAAVDVSGFGGTHWGRLEGLRNSPNTLRFHAAETFKDWGINTVEALLSGTSLKPNYALWASGGVRSGLDAAKLLGIGAQIIGFAKPILEAALQGMNAVNPLMERYEFELKVALFCTGSQNIADFQEKNVCQISQ